MAVRTAWVIKKLLEERLDSLYEDKPNGEISKDFYERKANEYSVRIKDLDDKISKTMVASLVYYDFGSKILEFANKASFLYEKANPEEKRDLLAYLISNSSLKDKKAFVSYKSPTIRCSKGLLVTIGGDDRTYPSGA